MEKLYFDSDYMEGCVPEILDALNNHNYQKTIGYGKDDICEEAKQLIRNKIDNQDADIYFLVGGTQTNATVIDALLKSYEGVLACDTGHIFVHEAGAIEQSAHKVLTIKNHDGKLKAQEVQEFFNNFNSDPTKDHCVPCGAIYISWPTEVGTLYSLQELKDLYQVAKENKVYLYIDGARLGYGLASNTDVTISDMAKYCDAFYIGGTKVGALFGEAVVFKNKEICPQFFTIMKRHGALLAKGWLLGLEYKTLFENDLYFKIGENAIKMANKLEKGFVEKGFEVYYPSPSNQRFFKISNEKMHKLQEKVSFSFWEKIDEENSCVRFVTSWATSEKQIDDLLAII